MFLYVKFLMMIWCFIWCVKFSFLSLFINWLYGIFVYVCEEICKSNVFKNLFCFCFSVIIFWLYCEMELVSLIDYIYIIVIFSVDIESSDKEFKVLEGILFRKV